MLPAHKDGADPFLVHSGQGEPVRRHCLCNRHVDRTEQQRLAFLLCLNYVTASEGEVRCSKHCHIVITILETLVLAILAAFSDVIGKPCPFGDAPP